MGEGLSGCNVCLVALLRLNNESGTFRGLSELLIPPKADKGSLVPLGSLMLSSDFVLKSYKPSPFFRS